MAVTLSQIQDWYRKMEKLGQADMPFKYGTDTLTPRQLIQHAEANDSVWKRVQPYLKT